MTPKKAPFALGHWLEDRALRGLFWAMLRLPYRWRVPLAGWAVSRVVAPGSALRAAQALAEQIAGFPQGCLLADRASAYAQWDMPFAAAMANEFAGGLVVLESGESAAGASRFKAGQGRHGQFS